MLEIFNFVWNDLLVNPMVNVTIVLARVLFDNYGLSIIVFTLLMRAATLPLMLRQVQSQRKMQQLQPQLNDIQKRVKDPKKRSEETMALYKEAGANPAGCLMPMLIQFPIWIALYDVIRTVLGSTPETLISLSARLYPWAFIQQAIPVGNHFLLWDMGQPDKSFVLPVIVAGSMWVQQKLTMTQSAMTAANASQAQTNQTLLWMMPLMFGWFTLTVPSGLAIYWLMTNAIGIVVNYYVFGWKGTSLVDIFIKPMGSSSPTGPRARPNNGSRPPRGDRSPSMPADAPVLDAAGDSQTQQSRAEKRGANGRNGRGGSKRKDGRRGNRPSAEPTRSGPQSGGGGGS